MKVLVTGAFGNIGCMVLDELLRRGHRVTAFDLENPANERFRRRYKYRIETAWGDVSDKESLRPHIYGKDAIIHLAALIPPRTETDPGLGWKVNVEGTRNVLELITECEGNPVLVFSSSFAVFGYTQDVPPPKTASSPMIETDNYSKHKIECEKMVRAHKKPWAILRLGASFDSRSRHVDKNMIQMMVNTRAHNRMEYVHPADVATAAVSAVERPEALYKVHLIGGGEKCRITQMEMFNTLLGAAGLKLKEGDFGDNPFYSDWMDTGESQRILEFQNHDFGEFRDEMYKNLKPVRLMVKPVSRLASWAFVKWARM